MPSLASGLFFNLWIGASMPSVLLDGVGPRQYAPWPLHREVERMKQFAHLPRMVGDAELLLDHPGNHRRGPHAIVQSVSHRPTIQNVSQLLALLWCQLCRPSGTVSFQQTLDAMGLILG